MFGITSSEWLAVISIALLTLFWIGMLVDAVLHEAVPQARLLWSALIFFCWVPGALVYALLRSGPRVWARVRRSR